MKDMRRKGFTIVELVIVIAVIAVLAAVLIPTFVNVTKKANMSADQQAVRQMNMVLASEDIDTFEEAVAALSNAGYNALDSLVPVSTGHTFWWVEEYNSIVLLNENDEVVFASNKDAKENFLEARTAGKAFNLKRGLPGKEITNVEDARVALEKGQSITLKADLNLGLNEIKISKGEDVVIDLGGNKITVSSTNTGDKEKQRSKYAIENHGTITIKNGTIEGRGIGNYGTMYIGEGVKINSVDYNGGSGVWNYASGNLTITGGTFTAVNDGYEVTQGSSAIANDGGTILITGGTFIGNGTVYTVNNYAGKMTIEGGTFTGKRGGIAVNGGEVVIKGGTITSNQKDSAYAIYVGSGQLAINDAVVVDNVAGGYDLCVESGTINLGSKWIAAEGTKYYNYNK